MVKNANRKTTVEYTFSEWRVTCVGLHDESVWITLKVHPRGFNGKAQVDATTAPGEERRALLAASAGLRGGVRI